MSPPRIVNVFFDPAEARTAATLHRMKRKWIGPVIIAVGLSLFAIGTILRIAS